MTKRRRPPGSGGRMPGGMPNQAALMRQIQKMQEDMEAAQAALEEETVEVSVGGGAVTVVITGHQQVKALTIDPDVIDTDDEEWLSDLQDLLVAAMNQAIERSQEYAAERMEPFAGGLSQMLPGGLGGMFG
jgi:DNA-binding YbaB/EbfC family protein